MTNTITFFDKNEELCELTGTYSHKELLDAGFKLDDWEFGFVSDIPWSEECNSYYQTWLLLCMARRRFGYKHIEFNGRHYYIVH